MASSQDPQGAGARLVRVLVFLIVLAGILAALQRTCPYRDPVQLRVGIAPDPANLQADFEVLFAAGQGYSERIVFAKPRPTDPVAHTLQIERTGQKNEAAAGADVRVLQVADETRGPLAPAELALTGEHAIADGSVVLLSDGAALTYRGVFNRILLTFAAQPGSGYARVVVDGREHQIVDLYAPAETERSVTIDVPALAAQALATVILSGMEVTALRITGPSAQRPLQVQSVQGDLHGQTIDLPYTTHEGVTTIDLAATGVHLRQIAFHPLVLAGHALLAVGGAWFVATRFRRRGEPGVLPAERPAPLPEANTLAATSTASWWTVQPRALVGPVLTGLSAGLQAMLAMLIILGPYREFPEAGELTEHGLHLYAPEWDLPIYVAGCAGTAVLCLVAVAVWTGWARRLSRRVPLDTLRACVNYSLGLQVTLSLLSATLFLVLLFARYDAFPMKLPREYTRLDLAAFSALPVALLVVTLFELWRVGRAARRPRGLTWWHAAVGALLDIAIPLGLITIVYIPPSLWSYVAGRCHADNLLHWSYFAMNAAVAYDSGMALGTDVYSQYGLGWPVLFVALKSILPLAYSNMLGVSIVYACLYYVGIYVLLRLALGSTAWAGLGALACVLVQMFNGVGPNDSPWMTPSSTCMRHPLDVWLFVALLLHLRSNRAVWSLVAGLVCGLAIVFETETGVYLLVTFAAYLVLEAWWRRSTSAPRGFGMTLGTWLLALAGILATGSAGFALASRGTFLTSAFWTGFTECLRTYAGRGVSLLPLAGAVNAAIGLFVLMAGVALLFSTVVVARLLTRQRVEGEDVLLTCLAWYSLGSLVLFVGRSHVFNLYHCAVPFVLTLVLGVQRAVRAWSPFMARSLVPLAGMCLTAAWLATNPTFLAYPSLARTKFKPERVPLQGVYLLAETRDVYLPSSSAAKADAIATLGEKLRHLTADGSRVAILDNDDTLLCLAGHCRPWSRYLFVLSMLHTRTQLENMRQALITDRPRYVVIRQLESRGVIPKRTAAADTGSGGLVLRSLHTAVEGLYQRIDKVGQLEVWELNEQR